MANSLQKGRYTKYSNKIGLYSNTKGSFIKNDTDVVLNFPFKDTVLEGGMSKEDVGRDERFLHIELDSKDIDTLEEPKVLTDFRYIDKDGEKSLTKDSDIEFFDEEGDLKQNLLIKGNNLLALYTLRERLAGKVKLIYIDPPYNTGNDGFRYNDKFPRSSWLVFMKNRLEVARELLRDDGVIFVQCDDNEQAYLKVLMDEVFSKENFIANLVWRKKTGGGQTSSYFATEHEYILVFKKSKEFLINYEKKEILEKDYPLKINNRKAKLLKLEMWGTSPYKEDRPSLFYSIKDPQKNDFYPKAPDGRDGRWRKKPEKLREDYVFWKESNGKLTPYEVIYYDEDLKLHKTIQPRTIFYNLVENTQATKDIINLFGNRDAFSYSKPEKLIQRIIEMSTEKGDIVLDYHLGSGTTCAVAHKMGRQWIGIEQMDYIEDIAKERLKKVIEGEQGGISKIVEWQGGGSFVYLELKKYNQEYVDLITKATSLSELEEIYVEMRNNAFLKFWFDRKDFEKDENFRKLDLVERKKVLIDVLDENQLYLNYPDMHDARHNVTEDEKALTDTFYGSDKN